MIPELEKKLDSFDSEIRRDSLDKLLSRVKSGEILPEKNKHFVNLHSHTFFSFNGYGYSPTSVAWRSFKMGLEAVGIVDFDVLDGTAEILEAGEKLGIRTVAGIETRVYVKEWAEKVINSPKEPGICYFIGIGFYRKPDAGSNAGKTLLSMKAIAKQRIIDMIERINSYLEDVRIDYARDVLSLTPMENATERHVLDAYYYKAMGRFSSSKNELISFWSDKLGVETNKIAVIIEDRPKVCEIIRSKLMKHGGPGYVYPDKNSFPLLEDVINMIDKTDALPAAAWLDGTSEGESAAEKYLKFFMDRGTVLVNIIPDRNWNIENKDEKRKKLEKLDEIIKLSRKLNLPLIAGTEMNKFGQKFVDEFNTDELKPYLDDFRKGAFFVYGHTCLARYCNKGYNSAWAKEHFPDRAERNAFYIKAGSSIVPGSTVYSRIKNLKDKADPLGIINK